MAQRIANHILRCYTLPLSSLTMQWNCWPSSWQPPRNILNERVFMHYYYIASPAAYTSNSAMLDAAYSYIRCDVRMGLVCVYLSVTVFDLIGHTGDPHKNRWTDGDAIWGGHSRVGPRTNVLKWGGGCRLAPPAEYDRNGDATLCEITSSTFFIAWFLCKRCLQTWNNAINCKQNVLWLINTKRQLSAERRECYDSR